MQQLVRARRAVPEGLGEPVAAPYGLELYWRAFWELASTRASAEAPIAWDKVILWCSINTVDDDMREELHYVVREMDKVWHETRILRQEEADKRAKEAAKRKGRR